MSVTMDDSVKRWTAKRKPALVIEIIRSKTTVAEASRAYDLSPSEIEGRVDEAKRGMENALRANPLEMACCAILEAAQQAITFNSASFPTCYGLVFTSRRYTALVRSYGLKQEFITPHCPQQNGMVERVIRTMKE